MRQMEPVDVERVRSAWEAAASDLDVRVQTEGCWLEGQSGDRFELAAIVPDFGGQRGMAIFREWDSAVSEVARARGYGFTVLGKSYEMYDRQLFEDTLNDWQWTGDGDPPPCTPAHRGRSSSSRGHSGTLAQASA